MVVWQNHAFPADFFVRHYEAWQVGKNKNASALVADVSQMPWMKWENCGLTYASTGGGKEILSLYKATLKPDAPVKLYRGTTQLESILLDLNHQVKTGKPYSPNWTHELQVTLDASTENAKSSYNAALKSRAENAKTPADIAYYDGKIKVKKAEFDRILKSNNELAAAAAKVKDNQGLQAFAHETYSQMMAKGLFAGIFTTPDLERAKLFSKGKVVSFEIPQKTLDTMLEQKHLYVGFENISDDERATASLEIGVLADSSPGSTRANADKMMDAYTSSTDAAAGTLFN